MRFLFCLIILFLVGCKEIPCDCGSSNCGIQCRNQCSANNCIPGTPCCKKCKCYKKPSIKIH